MNIAKTTLLSLLWGVSLPTLPVAALPSVDKLPPEFKNPLPLEGLPALPSQFQTPDLLPVPPATNAPDQVPSNGVTVQIESVEVLGSTVFSEAELQEAIAPWLGKTATFADLLALRTTITALYTGNGYVTSGAFLPAQDLQGGRIQIQVVEGAIEAIDIEGLNRLRPGYVRDRLTRAAQTPIHLPDLEAALQQLQRDPRFSTIQTELSAGTAPGLSRLTLRLTEADPLTVQLQGNNYDAPSVGATRGAMTATHLNLLGWGDTLSGSYGTTAGLDTWAVDYTLPINARNGTVRLHYDQSQSRVIEDPFSSLGIVARSKTGLFELRQPLVQNLTTEFTVGASLALRESRTFLLEDVPFSFSLGPDRGVSRVTTLGLFQEWVQRSPRRVVAARSQFNIGLDAFNATRNDFGIDGRSTRWTGQLQWVEAFDRDFLAIARLGGQLTGDRLLPMEQFAVGGVDTVRGYRTNSQVGDSGWYGSLEARFTVLRDDRWGTLQITPFFDLGSSWNTGGAGSQFLSSTGLGLAWQPGGNMMFRLDWGLPLTGESDRHQRGLMFSIMLEPQF